MSKWLDRVLIAIALAGISFAPVAASAQTCGGLSCITAHVGGVGGDDGQGNFNVLNYVWGTPGVQTGASSQITFTHNATAAATHGLMHALQTNKAVGNALLTATLQGTVFVSYAMKGVTITAIRQNIISTDTVPDAPLESVTLSFMDLVYTLQPVLPNGQKNGPPVSYHWAFP